MIVHLGSTRLVTLNLQIYGYEHLLTGVVTWTMRLPWFNGLVKHLYVNLGICEIFDACEENLHFISVFVFCVFFKCQLSQ